VVFNAHHDPIDFKIASSLGDHWVTVLDTAAGEEDEAHAAGDTLSVEARSMRVMRRR
jgi:pullulanase/glycogen debranching enzyme